MAMASAAALELRPLCPIEGLGARELCWMTGAGEPVGSEVSFILSSAAATEQKSGWRGGWGEREGAAADAGLEALCRRKEKQNDDFRRASKQASNRTEENNANASFVKTFFFFFKQVDGFVFCFVFFT